MGVGEGRHPHLASQQTAKLVQELTTSGPVVCCVLCCAGLQIKRTEGISTTDIVGRMLTCTRANPHMTKEVNSQVGAGVQVQGLNPRGGEATSGQQACTWAVQG